MEKCVAFTLRLRELRQQRGLGTDAHQQLQHHRIRVVPALPAGTVYHYPHRAQSLNNKKIKKHMLAYENNLKRLIEQVNGDRPPQELLSLYQRYNNELRMHLSGILQSIQSYTIS